MKLRNALLTAAMFALPAVASAQPLNGLYIGGGAGVNLMQDQTVKAVGGIATPGRTESMKIGVVGVGAIGWGYGNGLRTELELAYRYNGLDKLKTSAGSASTSGSEQKIGPMINILYDFNGVLPGFVPYVGAGAGYQWSVFHSGSTDTEGSFAYQAIAGGAIPVSPGLSVTGEYRFMGLAGDRKYKSGASTITMNDDYNHSFLIGLRYAFGAPTVQAAAATGSAAVPAPMVQPARSYIVFFDWDKATLTDRARQIIREAADASTKVQVTKIEVNGYTDTSGTPQYNQGLSIRRAQSVQAELIKDGVPAKAISIQGFGENKPLVPTGPNVREPQNRRVEIIIR